NKTLFRSEYLREGLKQKKTKLIYELKTNKLGTERTLKAAELSVALVKWLKAEKQVEYIAFSYDACLKLKELDKKAKVHYLNGDKSPQEIKAAGLSGLDYHLSRFITIEIIDRKSTRLNSSHVKISYAVFCLKKKKKYK